MNGHSKITLAQTDGLDVRRLEDQHVRELVEERHTAPDILPHLARGSRCREVNDARIAGGHRLELRSRL
jgi:hypothetical protein